VLARPSAICWTFVLLDISSRVLAPNLATPSQFFCLRCGLYRARRGTRSRVSDKGCPTRFCFGTYGTRRTLLIQTNCCTPGAGCPAFVFRRMGSHGSLLFTTFSWCTDDASHPLIRKSARMSGAPVLDQKRAGRSGDGIGTFHTPVATREIEMKTLRYGAADHCCCCLLRALSSALRTQREFWFCKGKVDRSVASSSHRSSRTGREARGHLSNEGHADLHARRPYVSAAHVPKVRACSIQRVRPGWIRGFVREL
jgi:hypothetical protein